MRLPILGRSFIQFSKRLPLNSQLFTMGLKLRAETGTGVLIPHHSPPRDPSRYLYF